MKTTTINLYDYKELDEKARAKALSNWNEDNDFPFLEECMLESLSEQLQKEKIEPIKEKITYSLGYSQGDGAMFYGSYKWKGYDVEIQHSGNYSHSYSKTIRIEKGEKEASEKTYKQFEAIFQNICKTLEKYGYDVIEQEQSEENFIETCEANEYTFESDGTMRNA